MDIDGTSNLDIVDIDGAVQIDGTVTVGVDGTGYDVKFFGASSGDYMLWDESADDLILAGNADLRITRHIYVDGTANLDDVDIDGTFAVDGTTISLDATTSLNIDNSNTSNGITIGTSTSGVPISIGHTTSETTINDNATVTGNLSVGGNFDVTGTIDFSDSAITNAGDIQLDSITGDGDTDTAITFSGSNVITVKAANANQVTFIDGAIVPSSDDDIDLGTNSTEFKDAFFDGTVTTDALTVSGATSLGAGTLALSALDIDGGTDIGEAIVDADLFIVDNGAGGTNRKVAASRLKTYAGGASEGFAIAMAVAL